MLGQMLSVALEQNLIVYSAAIGTCRGTRVWQIGLHLFLSMSFKGLEPNAITCSIAISACDEKWLRALQLLSLSRREELELNLVVHGAALSACERAVQWQQTLLILEETEGSGLSHNIVARNSAISACSKGRCWERTLNSAMSSGRESSLDVVTFSIAISSCQKCHQWMHVSGVLQRMLQQRLQPDALTVLEAKGTSESEQRWLQEIAILQDLQSSRFGFDLTTFDVMFSTCRTWLQSLSVLDTIRRGRDLPDAAAYNALVLQCERQTLWSYASFVLQELQQKKLQPDSLSYGSCLGACIKKRQWQWPPVFAERVRNLTLNRIRSAEAKRKEIGVRDGGIYHRVSM